MSAFDSKLIKNSYLEEVTTQSIELNTTSKEIEQITGKTVLAACFVASVVVFGVAGNAVIIASVVRDHRLHTRGNFLIA